jgi:hypothetical protein
MLFCFEVLQLTIKKDINKMKIFFIRWWIQLSNATSLVIWLISKIVFSVNNLPNFRITFLAFRISQKLFPKLASFKAYGY